ncbi:GlsB/YeaQ/YmgE family stress response membrane protein [Falsirhodobacter sp. 20TX0035]|uniref:GlsB/YeaQ/YmgE family stress response membrane protein n=1 Tax=Falsirhodobacter sp. 20TX0035 TaxID=3022019 RepID=UPI00232D164F|nr:GlsB/YeaQ/YmgE family stress response membrane protein [Falsirhodobacter sp. 20TX0035]MDB6453971.1 GlsB/YeaQ/YmgE family stress response membrane protein [Falsirhodobacter sp. 20TX0035]
MAGMGWIAAIIVGALAGWIAEKLMKSDQGILMNIILGILGAVLLNFILIQLFDATLGGWLGQLVVGVIGACILIALGRLLRRKT